MPNIPDPSESKLYATLTTFNAVMLGVFAGVAVYRQTKSVFTLPKKY